MPGTLAQSAGWHLALVEGALGRSAPDRTALPALTPEGLAALALALGAIAARRRVSAARLATLALALAREGSPKEGESGPELRE
eukprot:15456760-Alexandrium_andersonii.AAC.1